MANKTYKTYELSDRWLIPYGPKKIHPNYINFFAHLWQLNFLLKLVTLTLWWRITDSICKQKTVVLQNAAFTANVTELAFWQLRINCVWINRVRPVKPWLIRYNDSQIEVLGDTELARLAPKISSMTMRNFAVQRLGLTEQEVETISDECRENKESFKRRILVKWRNRNAQGSRKVNRLLLKCIVLLYG